MFNAKHLLETVKRARRRHTGHTGCIDGIELNLRYVERDGGRLQTGLHYFQRAGQYSSNRSPTTKLKDRQAEGHTHRKLDSIARTQELELQLFTPSDSSCDTEFLCFCFLAIIKLAYDAVAGISTIVGMGHTKNSTMRYMAEHKECLCWLNQSKRIVCSNRQMC